MQLMLIIRIRWKGFMKLLNTVQELISIKNLRISTFNILAKIISSSISDMKKIYQVD